MTQSLMSVWRYEATAPKRLWCCRPCQWTTTRLLPDTTGGVEKSLRRLPRDLRGGPLNINPYFLPKTGQVAVVSTRISFSRGALPCTPNRDW